MKKIIILCLFLFIGCGPLKFGEHYLETPEPGRDIVVYKAGDLHHIDYKISVSRLRLRYFNLKPEYLNFKVEYIKYWNRRVTKISSEGVRGPTIINGLVKSSPYELKNTAFEVEINEIPLKQEYETDERGIIKIPLKPIAIRYLVDSKVRIDFYGEDASTFVDIEKDILERILNRFYGLGMFE